MIYIFVSSGPSRELVFSYLPSIISTSHDIKNILNGLVGGVSLKEKDTGW